LKKGDCKKCGFVELHPSNFLTHWIVGEYSPILISEGNVNPIGINEAIKLENIPYNDRKDLFKKIMIYLSTAIRKQKE